MIHSSNRAVDLSVRGTVIGASAVTGASCSVDGAAGTAGTRSGAGRSASSTRAVGLLTRVSRRSVQLACLDGTN